jgi:hypothetical protein
VLLNVLSKVKFFKTAGHALELALNQTLLAQLNASPGVAAPLGKSLMKTTTDVWT